MRIALVSFEYPPDSAYGGIATYVGQVASLLHSRGHDVEVFTSSESKQGLKIINGIPVHYVYQANREQFKDQVLPMFVTAHEKKPFDIMESPEYNADGLRIKEKYPALPVTVKLHTPKYMINEMNNINVAPHWFMQLRMRVAGYRRFKKPNLYWKYVPAEDVEFGFTKMSDLVTTPSVSLGDIVAKKWNIPRSKIVNLPYPFTPSSNLLQLPISESFKVITYFGRLELRKGVDVFARVIPVIAARHPEYRFRFVGKDLPSPQPGLSMKAYLQKQLEPFLDKIEFIGNVPPTEIPNILADTAICIFPSKWENFPNVCLESMSAGRAVIGSANGGMKDMLTEPEAGLLINPFSVEDVVAKLEKLITDPALRVKMGEEARRSILKKYSAEVIGEKIELHYGRLIG